MGTSTIASSGGDYTSLSAWEAAKQANITGLGDEIANCESFTDTTDVTISGWTTTTNDRIVIQAASGHEHSGVEGAGYILQEATAGIAAITISEDFVTIDGIEIEHTAGSGNASRAIHITGIAPTNELVIKHCILHGMFGYGINNADGDSNLYIYNNFVYDGGTNCRGIWTGAGSTEEVTFNTVVNCVDQGIGGAALCAGNLVFDCGDDFNAACGANGDGFNISSDGAPGTTALNAETATDYITNATSGSENLLLKDGVTTADDYVTSFFTDEDGSNITTDIAGNTRGSTSDCGAHQFTVAATTSDDGRAMPRGIRRGSRTN